MSEVVRSEFQFCLKKMLRRARDAREMAIDFPCLKKEEDMEIIGITFVSKNLFYKRCLIDKYTS